MLKAVEERRTDVAQGCRIALNQAEFLANGPNDLSQFGGGGNIGPSDPLGVGGRAALTPAEILARHRAGKTHPLRVLDVLFELFNARHTSPEKVVSHKTRRERADFLRRFIRDLQRKAGFRTPPDPRNLGDRHIRAMVAVWQCEQLAPATIHTYLSFLRGLASWLGEPGFIRDPAHYGLSLTEYQRDEHARRDKSWTAAGSDIEAVIGQIVAYDRHVGASLRLIQAFGLRRKESVMFRPHQCVVPFEATALPTEERETDH